MPRTPCAAAQAVPRQSPATFLTPFAHSLGASGRSLLQASDRPYSSCSALFALPSQPILILGSFRKGWHPCSIECSLYLLLRTWTNEFEVRADTSVGSLSTGETTSFDFSRLTRSTPAPGLLETCRRQAIALCGNSLQPSRTRPVHARSLPRPASSPSLPLLAHHPHWQPAAALPSFLISPQGRIASCANSATFCTHTSVPWTVPIVPSHDRPPRAVRSFSSHALS